MGEKGWGERWDFSVYARAQIREKRDGVEKTGERRGVEIE